MPIIFLTVEEVAARLGVSRQRVYFLIHDGRLTAVDVDGFGWLVEEASVQNFTRLKRGRARKKISLKENSLSSESGIDS